MMDRATLVWSFKDAPMEYQILSPEVADWVVLVPRGGWKKVFKDKGGLYFYQLPQWLESPLFTKEGIYFFEVSEGRLLVIGKV